MRKLNRRKLAAHLASTIARQFDLNVLSVDQPVVTHGGRTIRLAKTLEIGGQTVGFYGVDPENLYWRASAP